MILITGGLGYIGSHMTAQLLNSNEDVIVIDDLSNSNLNVLEGIQKICNRSPIFIQLDIGNQEKLEAVFRRHDINSIVHFAASKAVGESVENPLQYYQNNIGGLVSLLKCCEKYKINDFIFSSSCTVYGQANDLPVSETTPRKEAESPYGNTKKIGEDILSDMCRKSSEFNCIALRYFNPIGCHPSAEIGELPIGKPQNLIPYLTQTVAGKFPVLNIFGTDYNTVDGTPIRDYIDVMDLVEAHQVALKRLQSNTQQDNFEIFNIGTGKGLTVLQIVKSFEEATAKKVPCKFAPRRQGDIESIYADTVKANQTLGWRAKRDLKDTLSSAWAWQKRMSKLESQTFFK